MTRSWITSSPFESRPQFARVAYASCLALLLSFAQAGSSTSSPLARSPALDARESTARGSYADPRQDAKVARSWQFERDGDTQGWSIGNGHASLEARTEGLTVLNTGPDPYFVGPRMEIAAASYPFVGMRVRSTAAGGTQIYFSRRDAPGFRENQMLAVPMEGDGQWHVYQVDFRSIPGWRGTIDQLRIDPVNGPSEIGARFEIEWIAIYSTSPRIVPTVSHWNGARSLVIGFENQGGNDLASPIEIRSDGALIGSLEELKASSSAEVEIDARALPAKSWIDASVAGKRLWRGRVVKPIRPALIPPRATDDALKAQPTLSIGSNIAVLSESEEMSVELAPLSNLTIQGPGNVISYYEFDAAPVEGDAPSSRTYGESLVDPEIGTLVCRTTVTGTTVRSTISASSPISVLRFEGPRMLEERPHTHALFPGLEYLDGQDASSKSSFTGAREADRSVPATYKITAPMIAVEYDRSPAPTSVRAQRSTNRASSASPENEPPFDRASSARAVRGDPWVAGMIWDIDNARRLCPCPPAAEFQSGRAFAYATSFLPGIGKHLEEGRHFASRPLELESGEPLTLECQFVLMPGTIEHVFTEVWSHAPPAPPDMSWMDGISEIDARIGPGSRDALESVLATSMLAYTKSLFDPATARWKSHIAIGETYGSRPEMAAAVAAESLRSHRTEYSAAVGIPADRQLEDLTGSALDLVSAARRKKACDSLAKMQQDGSFPYEVPPEMQHKIETETALFGSRRQTLGDPGSTNAGVIALASQPLLEYAAYTRDPTFVMASAKVLAKMNEYTVPRGAQTWEIHKDTPDLYAAARCAMSNLWGWRIFGDPHYLDEALRWAETGVPFLYMWEPPENRGVQSVDVNDKNGEGSKLELRPARLFYSNTARRVNPYATIPVFGTSWYSVTWFGIPVQWCGLAWANMVRDLDDARPVANLVTLADGVFRSAVNQQCDSGYLAGTLPDSWEVDRCTSRQPYIIPDRILEYAYRCIESPDVGRVRYTRLDDGRWTHVATRALVRSCEVRDDRLVVNTRFFRGQNASMLVGGESGAPSSVLVNGRALELGDGANAASWHVWDGARGGLVVRWTASGEEDQIEIVH